MKTLKFLFMFMAALTLSISFSACSDDEDTKGLNGWYEEDVRHCQSSIVNFNGVRFTMPEYDESFYIEVKKGALHFGYLYSIDYNKSSNPKVCKEFILSHGGFNRNRNLIENNWSSKWNFWEDGLWQGFVQVGSILTSTEGFQFTVLDGKTILKGSTTCHKVPKK